MNRRLEQHVLSPDIAPKQERAAVRRAKIEIPIAGITENAATEIAIDDARKLARARLAIAIDKPLPEPAAVERGPYVRRELAVLEKCTKQILLGNSPSMFGMIADLEITQLEDDSLGWREKIINQRARTNFWESLAALRDMQGEGATEAQILSEVAKKFFTETRYQFSSNSLVHSLADFKELNCEGRFKGVAATLEALGYDPKTAIRVREYADHIKALVKTKDGWVEFDGAIPAPVKEEDGVMTMSLHDYKRVLVGLEPEHAVESSLQSAHHGNHSLLGRVKDFVLSKIDQSRPVTHLRTDTRGLKSLENGSSFIAHLIPDWLNKTEAYAFNAVMNDPRYLALEEGVEAVWNTTKKKAATPRNAKFALSTSAAMALFSSLGPIIKTAQEIDSPEKASVMIKAEVSVLKAVVEEKKEEAAQVVGEVLRRVEKQKHALGERFDSFFSLGPKVEEEMNEDAVKASADSKHWDPELLAQVLPTLVMTSEEYYRFQAEQEYVYTVSDFVLEASQRDLDVYTGSARGSRMDNVVIDVGSARVVAPTFWKFTLKESSEAAARYFDADKGLTPHQAIDSTFSAKLCVYLEGDKLDDLATLAAMEQGFEDAKGEAFSISSKGEAYSYSVYVFSNGEPLYSVSREQGQWMSMYGSDAVEDDYLKSTGEWRDAVRAVPDAEVVNLATHIARKMGDNETIIRPKFNDIATTVYQQASKDTE